MSIQYELALNKLTTPPSYTPRVRPRATINLTTLGARIAASSTVAAADVQAVLRGLTTQIEADLLAGNWVALDGIGILTSSLTGRVPTPTGPLPANSKVQIGFRADTTLRTNLQTDAQLTRVDPSDQSPLLLTLTAESGDGLGSILPGNVLRLQGDRLKVNTTMIDEGVFFVPASGPAIEVDTFLGNGDKELLFIVPSVAGGAVSYTLEVRSRRKGSTALRTSAWPTPLITGP